jgi:hypothetical protein
MVGQIRPPFAQGIAARAVVFQHSLVRSCRRHPNGRIWATWAVALRQHVPRTQHENHRELLVVLSFLFLYNVLGAFLGLVVLIANRGEESRFTLDDASQHNVARGLGP